MIQAILIKYVLPLILIVVAVFSVLTWVRNAGETQGYAKGVASQKDTIDKLTNTINTARQAIANKTQAVEASTSNAVIAATSQQAAVTQVRTQIVNHYIHDNPTVVTDCGIHKSTVDTINQMLATQPWYTK